MSLIKSRKPISNLSPSIAFKINSPSKKFQNGSVQTLTSSLGSQIRHRCRCPLIQKSLDYNHLQEMAKEIQEESLDDSKISEEVTDGNTETFTNNSKGKDEILVWTLDPSCVKRCTCTSGKGLTFQQVLSNFQMRTEIKKSAIKNCKEPRINLLARKTTATAFNSTTSRCRTKNWIKSTTNNINNTMDEKSSKKCRDLKSNMQAMLKGLHNDFFTLNSKHQELNKQVNKNKEQVSDKMLKELEQMETALERKEKEIDTVVSLYKDMLVLRCQIKKLKEQKRTTATALSKDFSSKLQLLKQMQTYQKGL